MSTKEFIKLIITELDKKQLSDSIKSKLVISRQSAINFALSKENNNLIKDNVLTISFRHYWNTKIILSLLTIITAFTLMWFINSSSDNSIAETSAIDSEILTDDSGIDFWINPDLENLLKNENNK